MKTGNGHLIPGPGDICIDCSHLSPTTCSLLFLLKCSVKFKDMTINGCEDKTEKKKV
jgi:hypothetical protein